MQADAQRATDAVTFQTMAAPHLTVMGRLAARLTVVDDRIVAASLRNGWRQRERRPAADVTLGWLLGLVIDQAKRQRRWRRLTSGDTRPVELIDISADAVVLDLDGRRDLDRDIASLPWAQRVAVELTYVLGVDPAQSTVALRCDETALSLLLVQARAGLLDEVQPVELW